MCYRYRPDTDILSSCELLFGPDIIMTNLNETSRLGASRPTSLLDTRVLIGLTLVFSIAGCYSFFLGFVGHSSRRLVLVYSCRFLNLSCSRSVAIMAVVAAVSRRTQCTLLEMHPPLLCLPKGLLCFFLKNLKRAE